MQKGSGKFINITVMFELTSRVLAGRFYGISRNSEVYQLLDSVHNLLHLLVLEHVVANLCP